MSSTATRAYLSQKKPDTVFLTVAEELGYTKHLKTGESHKPKQKIAIIQWVSEQGELDDLYYYQIRLGIEKRAQELDYDILRYFNDHPFTLSEEVIGILCIGKFSRSQISAFEEYQKPLVFLDSDTLSLGHTCIITGFLHCHETGCRLFPQPRDGPHRDSNRA